MALPTLKQRQEDCLTADAEFYKFSNRAHADERFVPFALRRIKEVTERATTTGESDWLHQVRAGRFLAGGFEFSVPRGLEGPDTSLGHFTIITGHDERGEYVAYYDVWDLDPKVPFTDARIPFEVVAGKPIVTRSISTVLAPKESSNSKMNSSSTRRSLRGGQSSTR
jgi:hypothetical protein